MTKAQQALDDLLKWSGPSEIDSYPYVRDVFTNVFGYQKDHVRLADKGSQGKIPDLSLVSADVKPKEGIYWTVGEVKRERKAFRTAEYRQRVWETQLRSYVTADTVYALLIDPQTIAVLRPDGTEIKVVELDAHSAEELVSPEAACSLAMLHLDNSVCETSLTSFKDGMAPSRYLDVSDEQARGKFYESLRVSARDLIDYSLSRLREHIRLYEQYNTEVAALKEKVGTVKDERAELARQALAQRYRDPIDVFENILAKFESQIGRQLPAKEDEAKRFLENLYATEGSSLVLARILFVRFLEDHDMTSRKISNGGVKAFRDYHRHIKDDYQFLLTDAYKEAERLYRRLFEPSIFDWSHKGDGQLSRLLLRVFYRLNAFDFTKITGDILGNLYERFLDVRARKKLGEYYTPMYVCKYVMDRIGFYENPGPLLDPACGSGTFLIAAASGLIERLIKRGVKLDLAINQTIELVHGLDVNVFAAFIAQLQLIWHLLPYLKRLNKTELPELQVYGGINSLVHSGSSLLTFSGLSTEVPIQVRDAKYRYIVGNPPYIRNERLKDKGPWRSNYDAVDFRNSDIAYYFVARAIEGKRDQAGVVMPSWLEDGGKMCFVLPMGICDSRAASRIRDVLLHYRLLEITDMEDVAIHIFPSPQASGRATVAPVLVFVEKTVVNDSAEVRLVQVEEKAAIAQDIEGAATVGLTQKETFRQSPTNPYGQILPKLRPEDLPVLSVVMNHPRLEEFTTDSTPSYGVTVAHGGALNDKPKPGLLPMGKGANVYTFCLTSSVSSWVDLKKVRDKSIWGEALPQEAYALARICLAPQWTKFDPSQITLNDSVLVMVPKPEYSDFPWTLLLNSSPMRFVHLLTLRTALVGVGTPVGEGRRAAWCTIYPRTGRAYPVPKGFFMEKQKLAKIEKELSRLAGAIIGRWDAVARNIVKARPKHLALCGVDFSNWGSDIDSEVEYRITGSESKRILRPYTENQPTFLHIEGSYELLNVVKHLLEQRDVVELQARELQNLPIPEDYQEISRLIDEARDPDSPDIKEFKRLFKEADEMIAQAYGLNKEQWRYVQERLASPPFDVLKPRWPWKSVEARGIQAYDIDRFA